MDMPTAEDYIKAVQNPRSFTQPQLAAAVFDKHPLLGIPMPASGTTAIVFKATVEGKPQALRFFTRPDAATQQRYTALNRFFTDRDITHDMATSTWMDNAITVNGHTWPMLRMQWVQGRTLNHHVEDLVEDEDTASILALADNWRDLVRRIQTARFAHGDLQHGNVMVEGDGTLRLVDFDSAWIEPFAGQQPPNENGHRNYQRANRPWGPWMDTFPGLVIYLSLLALARDPKAWEHLHTGENLLFSGADFTPPYQTRTWWQLAQLGDTNLATMAAQLKVCCEPTWAATGDMESVLSAPVPWWTRTNVVRTAPATVPSPVQPRPQRVPPQPGQWWSGPVVRPTPVPPARPKVQRWTSIVVISLLVYVVWVLALSAMGATKAAVPGLAIAGGVMAGATFTLLAVRRHRRKRPPTLPPMLPRRLK
jgi:hypothetical protein